MKLHTKPLLLSILATSVFMLLAAPAYANWGVDIVFGWIGGFHDEAQPTMLRTWLILGAVIILETVLFWRLMRISFWRALLVSFVINVASTFAGILWLRIGMNSATASCLIFTGVIVCFVLSIILSFLRCPIWYWMTAVAIIISGLMVNYRLADVFPPITHIGFFFYLLAPLVYCLGMTLLLEGLFIRIFIKRNDVWKWLFIVNLISYLFLSIIAPFYATNPFRIHPGYNWSTYDGYSDRTVIDLARAQRYTNLYLLGLSENPYPPGIYEAGFEITVLQISDPIFSDMEILDELALDVLTVPDLSDSARELLQDQHEYFLQLLNVQYAIANGDQGQLNRAYEELAEYTDRIMAEGIVIMNIRDPGYLIIQYLEAAESGLTPPVTALSSSHHILEVFLHPEFNRNPDYAIEAIDALPVEGDVAPDESKATDIRAMRRLRPYFVFWSRARQAIAISDAEELQEVFDEWKTWQEIFTIGGDITWLISDPSKVIKALLEVHHSDLVVEGLDE